MLNQSVRCGCVKFRDCVVAWYGGRWAADVSGSVAVNGGLFGSVFALIIIISSIIHAMSLVV